MRPQVFADRTEAGSALAREISKHQFQSPVIVLGLPRGGVPAAYEVARALSAPLDVMPVRKIGMPWQRELAIGAIASGNIAIRDTRMARLFGDNSDLFERLVELLVAGPPFLGVLRQALSKSVQTAVAAEIPKNLVHEREDVLSEHLSRLASDSLS